MLFQNVGYSGSREQQYKTVLQQLVSLSEDVTHPVTLLANASALLGQFLKEINWVGFYIWEKDQLWLGPFQGLPACTQIPLGKGVCGTAAQQQKTLVIPNVHDFPSHIACDSASLSEIVIPLVAKGKLYGVLDIDSPIENRFDEKDRIYLEKFVEVLMQYMSKGRLA